jgi:hypothetical protein
MKTVYAILILGLLFSINSFAAGKMNLDIKDWDETFYWNAGLLAATEDTFDGDESNRGWTTSIGYDALSYNHGFSLGFEGSLIISPGESSIRIENNREDGEVCKPIWKCPDGQNNVTGGVVDTGFNSLTGAFSATFPTIERIRLVTQLGYAWTDYDDGRTNNDMFYAAGFSRSFGQLQARVLYRDFDSDTDLSTVGVDFGISF